MPHQAYILKDSSPKLGVFGGYGSGKTYTTLKSDEKHILNTPNGETLIGADTLVQLENTLKKDFEKDFPLDFVRRYNRQKNMITFINGHTLYYRHLADEGDIRSYNLTRAHILEASEVKHDSYIQLQTRLRNTAAIEYKTNENNEPVIEYNPITKQHHKKERLNWIQLIVESNPDSGWIKEDFLLKSKEIHVHHDGKQKYHLNPHFVAKDTRSHIIPSKANIHLPEDFIPSLEKGKPEWWVKRYIYGSFDYNEGLVYPMFVDHIVDPFPIPPTWKRMFGVDFGLRDPTVMIGIAIDPEEGVVYVYDEHYEAEKPVSYHAKMMNDIVNQVPPGMINGQIVADPSGQKRSGRDLRTYFNHYSEYGLWFKMGVNHLESGIMKVYTYFSLNKIKVMSNCINLIREGREYKYKQSELTQDKNRGEKPHDANNHAMDALRYVINELPDDPDKVVTEVYNQPSSKNYDPERYFPKALQDNDVYESDEWYDQF